MGGFFFFQSHNGGLCSRYPNQITLPQGEDRKFKVPAFMLFSVPLELQNPPTLLYANLSPNCSCSNEAQPSRVSPLGCSAAVEIGNQFVHERPAYEAIRSKLKYRCLSKEPWSLSAVLQNDSSLVREYMSLCFGHREALLACF